MRPWTVPFCLLLILAAGCAGQQQASSNARVAAHLQCPASEITITRASAPDMPGKVEGCGKTDYAFVYCLSTQGSTYGSSGRSHGVANSCNLLWFSAAIDQVSFATQCPREQITTQWLAPNLGVEACGARMTFTPTLNGWLLNTSSDGEAQPPTP